MNRKSIFWSFVRPFTLVVPAAGMIAGALMALGSYPKWLSSWTASPVLMAAHILGGALLAASLNVFSNGINQIYDVEIDRVNKPHRPLASGKMSTRAAWLISGAALLVSLALAFWISVESCLIVLAASLLTYVYSAPPLRTKRKPFLSNVTIALPRGTLLLVCGWSTVKTVLDPEPWLLGSIFGAYFLGAATTKDFSDIQGDSRFNCRTIPVVYGVNKAISIIAPFLTLPFLLLILFSGAGLLSGSRYWLSGMGVLLFLWGVHIVRLLRKDSEALSQSGAKENHPSWKHMYLMTLCAQFGIAFSYLFG